MKPKTARHSGTGLHKGPDHLAPYPVSRLAPAIELVDLAREIADADRLLNIRVNAKLKVIADQIRSLQKDAREILEKAKNDQDLNHVQCSFQRKPGRTYHLYQKNNGSRYFSLLSLTDWQQNPPHEFIGSFRLESDMSWTPADVDAENDNTRQLVEHFLDVDK